MPFFKNDSTSNLFNPLIDVTGGTIKNLNVIGASKFIGRTEIAVTYGLGSISSTKLTEDLYIENVKINNTKAAVSIDANGHNIYFKNCEFANRIEISNQGEVVFENCKFYTDAATGNFGYVILNDSMTFINCHFADDIGFYANTNNRYGTLTFSDCTVGESNTPVGNTIDFFEANFEVLGVTLYNGAFGAGDPGRTNFTCYVDGSLAWEAINFAE